MLEDITIKTVMDRDGSFDHIELWQGRNCIKLSFANTSLDVIKKNYHWSILKDQLDGLLENVTNSRVSATKTGAVLKSISEWKDSLA